MRILLVLTMLATSSPLALAQEPGAEAAQQSMQAIQQQQASEQAQQAQQQAVRDAQNATQAAATNSWAPYHAVRPKFSVKPGTFSTPTTVKITDTTRGAIIYYTTDGWSPTEASARYLGPITISATANLQAIAVVPYRGRSLITSGEYVIAGTSNATPNRGASARAVASSPTVPIEGTAVNFVFAADVSSKTAEVGDKIPLALAEDLKAGDTLIARKGSPGMATVIQVDKPAAGGLPGNLVFQVDSLNVNGVAIKLRGSEAREGEAKPPNAAVLIPFVGPFTALKHGKQAEITKGTPVTAFVDSNNGLALLN